jgi:hypothetical protein
MKKIIGLLIGSIFALSASTFASWNVATGATWWTMQPPKKDIVACIKTAALTREWYLQSAYRTFSDAVLVAYLRRSEALTAAYDSGKSMKEIKVLIRTAFETWKEKVKTARDSLQKERKERWKIFTEDVKKCKPDRWTAQEATQDASSQERSEGGSL